MKTYHYFGCRLSVSASDSLFANVAHQKLSSYNHVSSYDFDLPDIKIHFYNNLTKATKGFKISDSIKKNKDTLYVVHQYLTTKTQIHYYFKDKHLTEISLYFSNSLPFSLINIPTHKKYHRQLYLELFKNYVEQALLWEIARHHNLRVVHASAFELNGNAIVLAGANGVGKSTLSAYMAKQLNAKLIADNYLLIGTDRVFVTPDAVRLDNKSLQLLNLSSTIEYGFGKKHLHSSPALNWSQKRTHPLNKIYLITKGEKWNFTSSSEILKELDHLLKVIREDPLLSNVSMWKSYDYKNLSEFISKKVDTGMIQIGKGTIPNSIVKDLST